VSTRNPPPSNPDPTAATVMRQERKRMATADVRALLEVVGRVQRDHLEKTNRRQDLSASLSRGQLAEWFSKDRYVYAETIAEGGMARIYCAADLHLCRTVALKTLLEDQPPENVARFLYESQIAAQLQHPNVVPVYDTGLDEQTGRPFLVMKLIAGQSLLDIILGLRRHDNTVRRYSSLAERINIFLKVCDAISYAHAHNVVHRDIKPANVMVGEYGEVYVIDWGIAESRADLPPSDPETGRVAFGGDRVSTFHDVYRLSDPAADKSFMGSPVHMAPEQIASPDEIDHRSDVYGLGCTLYELITLNAPFSSRLSIDELYRAKCSGDFPPVWRYVPVARYGLADIVHRCMAPRKSRRFQKVTSLQNALKRHLQNAMKSKLPQRIDALAAWVNKIDPDCFDEKVKAELLDRLSKIARGRKP